MRLRPLLLVGNDGVSRPLMAGLLAINKHSVYLECVLWYATIFLHLGIGLAEYADNP